MYILCTQAQQVVTEGTGTLAPASRPARGTAAAGGAKTGTGTGTGTGPGTGTGTGTGAGTGPPHVLSQNNYLVTAKLRKQREIREISRKAWSGRKTENTARKTIKHHSQSHESRREHISFMRAAARAEVELFVDGVLEEDQ